MPVSVDLAIEHEGWTIAVGAPDALQALAERAVAAALGHAAPDRAEQGVSAAEGAEVSLLLCDDAFIRTLNRQWRGLDKPTNVLSFPSAAAARAMTLGDVAVAFETAAREAAERGVSCADHLTHLVVHGVLHLLGLDHETDAEAERMEALEAAALAALGVPSPYDEAPAAMAGGVAP